MAGRPGQEHSIIHACQPYVLSKYDIDERLAAPQTADDVPVEILVGQEWDHEATGFCRDSSRSR